MRKIPPWKIHSESSTVSLVQSTADNGTSDVANVQYTTVYYSTHVLGCMKSICCGLSVLAD